MTLDKKLEVKIYHFFYNPNSNKLESKLMYNNVIDSNSGDAIYIKGYFTILIENLDGIFKVNYLSIERQIKYLKTSMDNRFRVYRTFLGFDDGNMYEIIAKTKKKDKNKSKNKAYGKTSER